MRIIEKEFDIHFQDRAKASELAKRYNGRVRNNSHRLYGSTQAKLKKPAYAVRIKPRSFAHKIEIANEAKELGNIPDPWKH